MTRRRFSVAARDVGNTLKSAVFWMVLFALCGAGMLVAGIWLLYGMPLALLGGSACSFLFSTIILRGVSRG
jgi:hypothetical protein